MAEANQAKNSLSSFYSIPLIKRYQDLLLYHNSRGATVIYSIIIYLGNDSFSIVHFYPIHFNDSQSKVQREPYMDIQKAFLAALLTIPQIKTAISKKEIAAA